MENIVKKVSYLKGLSEGYDVSKDNKNGKIIIEILEILDQLTASLIEMHHDVNDIQEQVDEIDDDLSQVEEILFSSDEFDDEEDEMDFLNNYLANDVDCPNCGKTIYLDNEMFDDEDESIVCPSCGEEIELEFDCDCEDCNDEEIN